MRFSWEKRLLVFMSGLWANPLLADSYDDVPTIADMANQLIIGTDTVTKLVLAACFVVGGILVVSAIGQFRSHYFSPKMVPLDRPIIYLLLGMALFFVPFLGDIFVPTSSTIDARKQQESARVCPVDIDAPLEFGNEFNH